jgi:hypothetical protein
MTWKRGGEVEIVRPRTTDKSGIYVMGSKSGFPGLLLQRRPRMEMCLIASFDENV